MGFSLWHLFKVSGSICPSTVLGVPSSCEVFDLHLCFLDLFDGVIGRLQYCTVLLLFIPHAIGFFSIQAGLLFCNAAMILNRKRFLSKYGLDDMYNPANGAVANPVLQQTAGFLQAVHYLKLPVIIANILTIVFEILIGG